MCWYLIIALISNPLLTYDGEHFFICLSAICISSLVKYIFRSLAHLFKIMLFIFSLLSFKCSLYILDNSSFFIQKFRMIFLSIILICILRNAHMTYFMYVD